MRRSLAAVLAVAALVVLPPAPAEADLVAPQLTVDTEPGAVLVIDGRWHTTGSLELTSGGAAVNELALEDYVAGVAEMPANWPMEALKAQAVAARTYAWWSVENAADARADICATTACQVYDGADEARGPDSRWSQAVEATRGEVLVDGRGEPILARYFSTSGGRTYANAEVFPSTGDLPYLQAVDDPYDEASPYHRWQVRFSRRDFDELLARGERLSAVVPIETIERLGDVTDQGAGLRFRGAGSEVVVTAGEVRDFVSRTAERLWGDRYPPPRADGATRLPSTLPSSRFAVRVDADEVVFDGRGWGHGVGMGQYGALGRARQGQDYQEILAAYYAGLSPRRPAAVPSTIRVALDVSQQLTVGGRAPLRIAAGDGTSVPRALGTWTLTHEAERWRATPPASREVPLEVGDARLVRLVDERSGPVVAETQVSKPAELAMHVRDRDGEVVFTRDLGVVSPGRHAASWPRRDADGVRVPPGRYELAFVGHDEDRTLAGGAVRITVAADATPGGLVPWSALGVAAVVVVATAAALAVREARKART